MVNLLVATICFSLSFGLIKSQLSMLPSEFVVIARLFIAALIFCPFLKKLKLQKSILAMFIGAIQFGLMYLLFIKAFKFLQGNEIALLTTTTPVFVGIWSAFLGERFRPLYIFCILLSVIGAGIVVWHNHALNMIVKGVLLMEGSNCAFALGQVLWKRHLGNSKDKDLIALAYIGALIFVIPFATFVDYSSVYLSLKQILALLYLGIIPTGIGFWLWNKGAGQVSYSLLAVMNNIKIPLGILFSILLFHERVDLFNFLIGSALILMAVLILHINKL